MSRLIHILISLPSLIKHKITYSILGNLYRVSLLKAMGAKIGPNTRIRPGVIFKGAKNITIGSNVYIGERSILVSYGSSIIIGNSVLIAENAYISTRNHKFRDKNKLISEQGYKNDSVLIGDNCWLAHGAVVTAGTRLQSGSIISANTVANKNESEPSIHKNMIEQIYIESDEF